MNQDMDRLEETQSSNGARLPRAVEQLLEDIARRGIRPHLLFERYTTVFGQGLRKESSHAAQAPPPVLDNSPSPSGSEGQYGCPWCSSMLKQEKDFIRHVKEKCCAETEFRCPDCSKTYTRKHRLANHHKIIHPQRCGSGPCAHVYSNAVKLNNAETLGCGFCFELFHSDLHGYLRHVINHYRAGATLAEWQSGTHIPSSNNDRPFSPPPKIRLRALLEEQNPTSNFAALRSGFGLQDDSPCRTYSAISHDSTLFDGMDMTEFLDSAAVKDNWDPFFNPTNMAFINSVPTQSHSFDHSTQYQPHGEDFGDMMQYLDHNPTFGNDHFIDTSNDTIVQPSAAVIAACTQLDTGMDIDAAPAFPPFNPTPPLDLSKARKASMSGRLIKKFQSLSPLRTEF